MIVFAVGIVSVIGLFIYRIAGWFAVIEVNKDDIAGCTSFDAVIRL